MRIVLVLPQGQYFFHHVIRLAHDIWPSQGMSPLGRALNFSFIRNELVLIPWCLHFRQQFLGIGWNESVRAGFIGLARITLKMVRIKKTLTVHSWPIQSYRYHIIIYIACGMVLEKEGVGTTGRSLRSDFMHVILHRGTCWKTCSYCMDQSPDSCSQKLVPSCDESRYKVQLREPA